VEIVASEQAYVNYLNTIAVSYRIPLEAQAAVFSDAVSADEIKSLFRQIDVLLAYHRRLLEQLLECQRQWSESSTLGGVFLEIAQFLRLYSNYVNHYPRSQEILKRMYLSPSGGKLLRQLDEQPEARKLSLKDYLIMPVQRVPRYILLLQALLKATPPEHADVVALQQAKGKLEEVAEMLEVSQRVSRNGQALMRIQAALCPRNTAERQLNLIQPDRWFVREGKVRESAGALSARAKVRQAYLFSDLLLVTKIRPKAAETITRLLLLSDIASVRGCIADGDTIAIAIAVAYDGSEFHIASCESHTETKAWLSDLVLHKAKAEEQAPLKSPGLSHMVSLQSFSATSGRASPTSRQLQEASSALSTADAAHSSSPSKSAFSAPVSPTSSSRSRLVSATPGATRHLSALSSSELSRAHDSRNTRSSSPTERAASPLPRMRYNRDSLRHSVSLENFAQLNLQTAHFDRLQTELATRLSAREPPLVVSNYPRGQQPTVSGASSGAIPLAPREARTGPGSRATDSSDAGGSLSRLVQSYLRNEQGTTIHSNSYNLIT